MFNEPDIQYLWECFSLDRNELSQGSSFRMAFTALQTFDDTNSTTLVNIIQIHIGELQALESATIPKLESESKLSSYSVVNQFSQTYRDGGTQSLNIAYAKKERLKAKIWKILELDTYIGSPKVARVKGVNSGSGFHRARML